MDFSFSSSSDSDFEPPADWNAPANPVVQTTEANATTPAAVPAADVNDNAEGGDAAATDANAADGDTEKKERRWERPWQYLEMREQAEQWSLSADHGVRFLFEICFSLFVFD